MAENQVHDYDDIRERLSILKDIQMAAHRELDITNVLEKEIEAHRRRRKSQSKNSRRTLGWIGSASAAVAVAVFAIGVIMVNHGQVGESASNRTTASQKRVSSVPIHYTSAQLKQVKGVAQAVGVTPWIPKQGLAGDKLTIIKNGGKGLLILDYKNFWLNESTSPLPSPQGIPSTTNLTIGNMPAEYITVKNQSGQSNSFLYFQHGSTYISVENLRPRQAIPIQTMKAIGESFEGVQ